MDELAKLFRFLKFVLSIFGLHNPFQGKGGIGFWIYKIYILFFIGVILNSFSLYSGDFMEHKISSLAALANMLAFYVTMGGLFIIYLEILLIPQSVDEIFAQIIRINEIFVNELDIEVDFGNLNFAMKFGLILMMVLFLILGSFVCVVVNFANAVAMIICLANFIVLTIFYSFVNGILKFFFEKLLGEICRLESLEG